MPKGQIFLERRNYRTRRMIDALRVLPVLGLLLWMVPLLWPLPDGTTAEPMPMSAALKYLFGVWIALVIAAWVLWRRTAASLQTGDQPPDTPD